MTTPANYATLIAEIDVVIESYGLSLQEVFGGRSTQPTLQELIDLRYELFEVDADPSQITSTSKPTTRADGSALQQGDRWYNPSTGVDGFWNGTYWLGQRVHGTSEVLNGGGGVTPVTSVFSSSIFVEYINWFGLTGAVHDSNNYFGLRFYGYGLNGAQGFSASFANTSAIGAAANYNIEITNTIATMATLLAGQPGKNIGLSFFQVGSPTTSGVSTNLAWRVREIL